MLTTDEVCDWLRVSRMALSRLVKSKRIAVIKLNQKANRYRKSDIEHYLDAVTTRTVFEPYRKK